MKISIIIPVYNVEPYLRHALDSVVNQTLKDIEIICVDDCSSDNSWDILCEYAQKDERFKIFKQEFNQGPGTARNRALDVANSEYIMFLDPDDWLDLSACEILYNQAIKYNNDMVMLNYNKYYEDTKTYVKVAEHTRPFVEQPDKNHIVINKCNNNFFISTFLCFQIYKKSLLDEFNIKFTNHRFCEDDLFVVKAFLHSKNMSIIPESLYFYRIRQNSLMHNLDLYFNVIETKMLCYNYVSDYCDKNNLTRPIYYFVDYLVNSFTYYLDCLIMQNYLFAHNYYNSIKKIFIKIQNKYPNNVLRELKKYKKFKKITNTNWFSYFLQISIQKLFYLGNTPDKRHKIIIIAGIKFKIKKNRNLLQILKNFFYFGNSIDKSHKIIKIFGIKLKLKKNYLKKIKKNYKRDVKRIKEKFKIGEKIDVLFLVTDNSKWKYQYLYEILDKSNIFLPRIGVTISDIILDYDLETQYKILDFNYNFFKNKGMNVIYAWDKDNNSSIDLTTLNCDIVFYQQRYRLAENQSIYHVSKKALTCYVPYYLPDYIVPNLNYDNPFFFALYRYYVLNKSMEKDIKQKFKKFKICSNNIKGVGHTMLDYFYYKKNIENKKKYVIYAPHWSIFNPNNEDTQYISTFDKNGQLILAYAKKHPEINWVFKPHPSLKIALKRIGWSEQEIETYYSEWENIGIYCDDCSYIDLFFKSKCLITDCGSFLLEYFCTNKPLIHLISSHNKNKPYKFNEKIFDTFYNIYNNQELVDTLDLILLKDLDPKKKYRNSILKESHLIDHSASECIANDLLNIISK